MRELDVQNPVVAYARSRGWRAYKFASEAQRSVPDYIFFRDGVVRLVEFKAPGKEPNAHQADEHDELLKVGILVDIIDNVDVGKELIDLWEL